MSEQNEASTFEEPVDFGRPIITRGRLFSFPLRSLIRKSAIGPGSCPSIVWDAQNAAFYGLVIGREPHQEPHLFMFDSNSTVEDIGAAEGVEAVAGFLVFDGSERLLCCLNDSKGDSRLFLHPVTQERRMYSHMWGHFMFGPIEPLGTGIKEDRAIAGAANPVDSGVYLVTASGLLYRVDLDKDKVERLGTVPPQNLSAALVCDPSTGSLYGVSGRGRLWRWDGSEVTVFDARVPTMKNRDYAASCSSLVWHEGKIYGSTLQDAYLFEFAPAEGFVRNLGRPDENTEIRGIDVLPDGRVFGITATPGRGMGHLFCYSRKTGFSDLGVIHGWQPINDFAYEPLCIRAGASGEFLIGNGEARSNVFLYCSAPES
jgi:hypothetical protein